MQQTNKTQNLLIKSVIGISFGYLIWRYWQNKQEKTKRQQFLHLLQNKEKQYEQFSQELKATKVDYLADQNLTVELRYIPLLQQKDKLPTTRQDIQNAPKTNPFLPPYQKGKLLCNLDPNHRVLKNKFYYLKNHLLLITKQFIVQNTALDYSDWKQLSFIIQATDGVAFFNCGEKAGISQNHKHIHILPHQGFKFPLFNKIWEHAQNGFLEEKYEKQIYQFKYFNFVHGICRVSKNNSPAQNLKSYQKLLKFLQQKVKVDKFDHNFIFSSDLIIIIPRKGQKFCDNKISLNSAVFFGFILIKYEKFLTIIQQKYKSPAEIFQQITYPWQHNQ